MCHMTISKARAIKVVLCRSLDDYLVHNCAQVKSSQSYREYRKTKYENSLHVLFTSISYFKYGITNRCSIYVCVVTPTDPFDYPIQLSLAK